MQTVGALYRRLFKIGHQPFALTTAHAARRSALPKMKASARKPSG